MAQTTPTQSPTPPECPHSRSVVELISELETDSEQGLSAAEAERRLKRYGPNEVAPRPPRGVLEILLAQLKSLVVLLLIAAMVLSLIFGDWVEGLAIGVVILVNTAIGFFTESRAVRSMEALREMTRTTARVRRGGEVATIDAARLVPGDLVVLEAGDVVPADLRLVEASKLRVNESALTGESVPRDKQLEVLPRDTEMVERTNLLFHGTALTRGSAEALVVATGGHTELAEIVSLAESAGDETTPLERRLEDLGQKLVGLTIGVAVLVGAAGFLRGEELLLMVETAVALAVAAIPEGLPIVATIALARGLLRLARQNALVRKLSAVETLGGTRIILVDKTGTLTENRLQVASLVFADGEQEADEAPERWRETLKIGVLCNNASLPEGGPGIGDPLEVALLEAGREHQLDREQLLEELPEAREVAFDPEVRMMATFHRAESGYLVAVKGAPEAVLESSSRESTPSGDEPLDEEAVARWGRKAQQLAARGYKVVALAQRRVDDAEVKPYEQLEMVALAGIADPPRPEVGEAVKRCQRAGMRLIMATGDHPDTARSIGRAVGLSHDQADQVITGRELAKQAEGPAEANEELLACNIFARVTPRQKLQLVKLHQKAGSVVAMTGDGVNDAPALRQADIGIAMGKQGTQAAREAATMVLQDDKLGTIVTAVEQGRVIFGNIRRFVHYLMSCNLSEVLCVALATLAGMPLPLTPLQILFLNLVNDVFPALALGAGPGEPGVMERPPRPVGEPVVPRPLWYLIGAGGLVIALSVLLAFFVALEVLDLSGREAVTISFLTLSLAQLVHVLNVRSRGGSPVDNEVTRNPWVAWAVLVCVGLILLVLYVPPIARVLSLVPPGGTGWALVIGASLIPLVVGQAWLSFGGAEEGGES